MQILKNLSISKLLVVSLLLRLILTPFGNHIDLFNHIDWGRRFWEYGPFEFYSANVWNFTWPNQPPGTIYIFAFVNRFFEAIFYVLWKINVSVGLFPSLVVSWAELNLYPIMLKLPAILSDLGIAYLLYKIARELKDKKTGLIAGALFLFNPVIWYNSSVWGQTDSIINFFALLSFLFLFKKKLVPAVFFLAISFFIKASLFIFLPVFAFTALWGRYKISEWLKAVLFTSMLIILFTLPFSLNQNPVVWLLDLYNEKILGQQLQVITANAFNPWASLIGLVERPHTLFLGPFTFAVWGYFLFGASFVPILYYLYKNKNKESIFIACALTAFSSWIFLTNMHERYLYPLFPYLAILVSTRKKLISYYWLISLINLLNLYNLWWFPDIAILKEVLIFKNALVPRVLGLINLALWAKVYFYFVRAKIPLLTK